MTEDRDSSLLLVRAAVNACEIARQGGIPALLQVMETHLHESLIQEYSAASLQNLATDGPDLALPFRRSL